ncbi:MAG TPA: hypothetical protein VHM48_04480 [Candidatus Limnocylindrales bacterium]|nr:hypothetical protein [Candidatus Limnocylindrales bacterium]
MLRIVFGLPTYETFQAAKRGELALGGCVVWPGHPTNRCTACGEDVVLDSDDRDDRDDRDDPEQA